MRARALTINRPSRRATVEALIMSEKELSQELREGEGGHLTQRRGIVALGLAVAGSMGLIALSLAVPEALAAAGKLRKKFD